MLLKTGAHLRSAVVLATLIVLGSDAARADPENGPQAGAAPTAAECISASNDSLASGKQHKLHAARARLLVCAAASCPPDVRGECLRRVSEVNAAMPTIVFEAHDRLGNDVSAVKVTMDGEPLAVQLDGKALSIDPGAHSFAFEAPGQPVVLKGLVIREGEKNRRERVEIGPAPRPPAPASAPAPGATGPGVVDRPWRSSGYTVGLVLGGAGLVATSVGATLLALSATMSHRSSAETASWPAMAQNDQNAARTDEIAGLVLAGGGVAALATAAYLVLSSQTAPAPSSSATALRVLPLLGTTHTGLGLHARF
jgi:hypothetical protein